LKNNKDMRIRMGKINAEKIATKYNWKHIAETYSNIYTQNLNGHYK